MYVVDTSTLTVFSEGGKPQNKALGGGACPRSLRASTTGPMLSPFGCGVLLAAKSAPLLPLCFEPSASVHARSLTQSGGPAASASPSTRLSDSKGSLPRHRGCLPMPLRWVWNDFENVPRSGKVLSAPTHVPRPHGLTLPSPLPLSLGPREHQKTQWGKSVVELAPTPKRLSNKPAPGVW